MNTKKFISACLLLAGILAIPDGLIAEQKGNPSGLTVSGGIFSGTHNPDLEDKYYNDALGSGLISGGIGFTTPWENKEASGVPLSVRYNFKSFLFTLEHTQIKSSPEYLRFVNARSGNIVSTLFDSVSYENLIRENTALYAGWLINSNSENNFFYLLGGMRSIEVNGDANVLGSFSITSLGSGMTSSHIYSGVNNVSRASASGPTFGLRYRHEFANNKYGIEADAMVSSMKGTWMREDIFIWASQSGIISGSFARENGNYKIGGTQFRLRGDAEIIENLKVFGRILNESYIHEDSQVIYITHDMLTNTGYPLTFLLTYPGSANREDVSGLEMGVDYRFDL